MTPKEKARQLVERFREYSHTEFISYRGGYQLDTQIQNAKQCALIAVDEIIANIEPSASMDVIAARIEYWQEVKTEIQSL
jgi:hypothetical protein